METGARFGPYEILSPLGTGGMGEVYRARDVELGRVVAVKVLRAELASDADLVGRLHREARLLASLEHPRVARLYSFAEADGRTFLAMELVDGETLAERIARGPLPVSEALSVCAQIAEGLDAAHLAGVVHRDLKPANVLLDAHGDVHIADFGIARSTEPRGPEATSLPTSGQEITGRGIRLGTAPYMSPEQARGHPIDARTDIWALGCTLYECLTGVSPFERPTPADTTSATLSEEPDFSQLPPGLPASAKRLLERMLRKDARERQRSAGDVWLELREALAADPLPKGQASLGRPTPAWQVALGGIAVTALAVSAAWLLIRPAIPDPPTPARFQIPVPPGTAWRFDASPLLAISPDGESVVFTIDNRLWLRRLDSLTSTPIPGTEDGRTPFFSPDGAHLAFWVPDGDIREADEGQIKRVSLEHGGAPVPVAPMRGITDRADWAEDGFIYWALPEWADERGILRVREQGGASEIVVEPLEGEFVRGPRMLPGGEWLLFTATRAVMTMRDVVLPVWEEAYIVAQSVRSGERRELIAAGTTARYAPTGHIVYASEYNLFAVPFDLGSATVTGAPVSVLTGVHQAMGRSPAQYEISRRGDLVYLPGGNAILGNGLVWVDRAGAETMLPLEPTDLGGFSLSPDGRRVAIGEYADGAERSDVWIHDLDRGDRMQLTTEGYNRNPVWSADGDWIYFTAAADSAGDPSIWRVRVDRAQPPEHLLTMDGITEVSCASGDGGTLVFGRTVNSAEIWMMSLRGDADPQALLSSPSPATSASLSPDGRFVAFQSAEDLGLDVFVQELASGRRYPVSTALMGGRAPVWSADGRRIFFYSARRAPVTARCPGCDRPQLLEVDVQLEPRFSASAPRPITPAEHSPFTKFAATPDGERFLVNRRIRNPDAMTDTGPLVVVLDWFEELKRRAPRRGR